METADHLTVPETAALCKVAIPTVRGWLFYEKHGLKKIKAGGRVLITRASLDAFLAASTAARDGRSKQELTT